MRTENGSALLAVMWLAAGLSAIAFSVASTVRGETERAETARDAVRAYYLAAGAIDRALLYMSWGPSHRNPDGSPRYWMPGMASIRLPFPTGETLVEVVPEASRMNINTARPPDLMRLMLALGQHPERAQAIVAGIVDWRSPVPPGQPGPFDSLYLSRAPSFRARHASFEEIEELMLVAGVTTELFHGAYERDPEGRLFPRSGLKRCLSVWGANDRFDALGAEPAVLVAAGVPPEAAAALVRVRRENPLIFATQPALLNQIAGPAAGRLRIGGNSIYTLRATATLRLPDGRLSDIRRSVAATVKFNQDGQRPPFETLRWYENAGM